MTLLQLVNAHAILGDDSTFMLIRHAVALATGLKICSVAPKAILLLHHGRIPGFHGQEAQDVYVLSIIERVKKDGEDLKCSLMRSLLHLFTL